MFRLYNVYKVGYTTYYGFRQCDEENKFHYSGPLAFKSQKCRKGLSMSPEIIPSLSAWKKIRSAHKFTLEIQQMLGSNELKDQDHF